MTTENLEMDYSKYDFKDSTEMYVHLSKKGLSKETVIGISKMKNRKKIKKLMMKIQVILPNNNKL